MPRTKTNSTRVTAESETFIVTSSLPQEEILEALSALDHPVSKLTVRVSGKQFIIAKRAFLVNPFARSLFGVVHEASPGSIVDYSFSVKPAVRILFSMWFALMTVVFLTGLSSILTSGLSEVRLELVVLSVIFLAGALGVVSLCLLLSRNSEKEMERALFGIIHDTVHAD